MFLKLCLDSYLSTKAIGMSIQHSYEVLEFLDSRKICLEKKKFEKHFFGKSFSNLAFEAKKGRTVAKVFVNVVCEAKMLCTIAENFVKSRIEWISEGRSENRSTALTKRLCESQN